MVLYLSGRSDVHRLSRLISPRRGRSADAVGPRARTTEPGSAAADEKQTRIPDEARGPAPLERGRRQGDFYPWLKLEPSVTEALLGLGR